MQELEREYEKIAKAVADGQAQMLRIEGAILMLRELIDKEAQAQKEQEPQG